MSPGRALNLAMGRDTLCMRGVLRCCSRSCIAAIDARPFKPFKIEIVSGRQIDVTHPDNIFVLPTRQRVISIQVYQSDTWEPAILFPEHPPRSCSSDSMEFRKADPSGHAPAPEWWHCLQMEFTMAGFSWALV